MMKPIKVRKKPVEVEAIQWLGNNPGAVKEFLGDDFINQIAERRPGGKNEIIVKTMEGSLSCPLFHWIIRGVKGEHYPCDPFVFSQTYEEVS